MAELNLDIMPKPLADKICTEFMTDDGKWKSPEHKNKAFLISYTEGWYDADDDGHLERQGILQESRVVELL